MILVSGEALIDLIPADRRGRPLRRGARRLALQRGDRPGAPGRADRVRLADFRRRQRRVARRGARRRRRRPQPRRTRRAADDARLRHARHRADRLALRVLSRRHQLRRRLAIPGDLAGRGAPSARRFDLRRRSASRRQGRRRARPRQGRRDDQLRSQHPAAGDAGPRQRRARWSSGRSRSPRSSRRATRTSNGSIPAVRSRRR